MKPPAALLTRRIPSAVLGRLRAACDTDLYVGDAAIPRAELLARVRGKQALLCLLTDRVDEEVLAAGGDLRIVANIAVGYDNIDVPAARARGIVVTNTPDVLTEATAELTWALILAITRRVPEGDRLVRQGGWRGWALDFMLGTELRGKQLGIVGLGRIGSAVAARAPAFGMSVVHHSLGPATASAGSPLRPPEAGDEEALAWALGERLIAGAALDVYEREPAVHERLVSLDNVVLAPHLGSATTETRTAMADLAVRNVVAVLAGEPPLTPVP